MTIPVPIATMLELPELIVTGCEGGIEIVMLCSLPDEEDDDRGAIVTPATPARPDPDRN